MLKLIRILGIFYVIVNCKFATYNKDFLNIKAGEVLRFKKQ